MIIIIKLVLDTPLHLPLDEIEFFVQVEWVDSFLPILGVFGFSDPVAMVVPEWIKIKEANAALRLLVFSQLTIDQVKATLPKNKTGENIIVRLTLIIQAFVMFTFFKIILSFSLARILILF